VSDPAGWVGSTEQAADRVEPWPAAALTAALGRDDPPGPGQPLPAFWHQLYCRPIVAADRTGPDGHAARGGFLPPAEGRRMWAGGRVRWHLPIRIGEASERVSTVRSVTEKQGRSGPLLFVTVEHRYVTAAGTAVVEEQDIVYRVGGAAGPAAPAPGGETWRREWCADPVLLFRYSGLTANGHRIHYDQAYAREVEGYDGLVVHGPLLATLLLDLVRRERPDAEVRRFTFRAMAPVLADTPLAACGRPEDSGAGLWIATGGALAMTAEVELG
jgi:3-methylfumaryl-CoA hydratase